MAVTPNMNLTLPTVGVTAGPAYATQNNQAFTDVDEHDHTVNKGVQVPTAGININADLSFSTTYGSTNQKFVEFAQQATTLSGAGNEEKLHSVLGDLHWTNEDGTTVQITNDASLDLSATGGFGGDYTTDTDVEAAYTTLTKTFTYKSDAALNKAAAMDGGALTLRETDVAAGDGVTIKVPATIVAPYNWTLPDANPSGAERILKVSTAGVWDFGSATHEVYIGDGVNSFGDYEGTDQTPFNSAITALSSGGVIKVGRGTYTFTAALAITQDDITIVGEGRDITILTSATDDVNLVELSADNIHLQDLRLRHQGSAQASSASEADAVFISTTGTNCTVTRCSIEQENAGAGTNGRCNPVTIQGSGNSITNNVIKTTVNSLTRVDAACVMFGNNATTIATSFDIEHNVVAFNNLQWTGSTTQTGTALIAMDVSTITSSTVNVRQNVIYGNLGPLGAIDCDHAFSMSSGAAAGSTTNIVDNVVQANCFKSTTNSNAFRLEEEAGAGTRQVFQNCIVGNTVKSGVASFLHSGPTATQNSLELGKYFVGNALVGDTDTAVDDDLLNGRF